jgi:hypothetical protein
MEEVAIMQRILPEKEFLSWVKKFAPQLFSKKMEMGCRKSIG